LTVGVAGQETSFHQPAATVLATASTKIALLIRIAILTLLIQSPQRRLVGGERKVCMSRGRKVCATVP
jgi:hypothetical protein